MWRKSGKEQQSRFPFLEEMAEPLAGRGLHGRRLNCFRTQETREAPNIFVFEHLVGCDLSSS